MNEPETTSQQPETLPARKKNSQPPIMLVMVILWVMVIGVIITLTVSLKLGGPEALQEAPAAAEQSESEQRTPQRE